MFRIDTAHNAPEKPTPLPPGTGGYFQDTDPAGGTEVSADWLNHVQEELVGTIIGLGGTLSKSDDTLLWTQLAPRVEGIYSDSTDTTERSTAHDRVLVAAFRSQATGEDSAVIASAYSASSGDKSAALASVSSAASGPASVVISSIESTASGQNSACIASAYGTPSGPVSAVISTGCGTASGVASFVLGAGDVDAGPVARRAVAAGDFCGAVCGKNFENATPNSLAGGYNTGAAITPSGTNQNLSWLIESNGGHAAFAGKLRVGGDPDTNTATETKVFLDGLNGNIGAKGGLNLGCSNAETGTGATVAVDGATGNITTVGKVSTSEIQALKSHETDTGSSTTTHLRAVIASSASQASGAASVCAASSSCVASGAQSANVASASSTVSGTNCGSFAGSSNTIAGDRCGAFGSASFVIDAGSRQCFGLGASSCLVYADETNIDNSGLISSVSSICSGDLAAVMASWNCQNNHTFSVGGGYSATSITPISETDQNLTWLIESNGGNVTIDGSFVDTGIDYAETFENLTRGALPVGCLVAREKGTKKVRLARPGDRILGVVSATPTVVGGDGLNWSGKFKTDEWGRIVKEEAEIVRFTYEAEIEEALPEDETITRKVKVVKEYHGLVKDCPVEIPQDAKRRVEYVPVQSEEFDPKKKYVPRRQRPDEWTVVGLVGQMRVRVDKTVGPDDFVAAGKDGLGTKAPDGVVTRVEVMEILVPWSKDRGYGIANCLVGVSG